MSCPSSGFLTATDARNIAKGDKVINAEICAIQQKILDAIQTCAGNGKFSIVINGGTPITSSYGISGITIVSAGSTYIEDSPVVSVSSVNGINFAASPVVNPVTGAVTSFFVTNVGQEYEIGDAVSVAHAGGVTGTAFVGEVSLVSVEASFDDSFSSDFTIINNSLTTGVNIGEILGITITDGGTNYFNTPHLTLIDPAATGSGFIGQLILNNTNGVDSINIIDPGVNYSAGTAAVIWGNTSGSPAVLTVQADAVMIDVDVDSEYYFKVWAKIETDPVVSLQLDIIQDFFSEKGYTITAKTNPVTMNTIQWQISW